MRNKRKENHKGRNAKKKKEGVGAKTHHQRWTSLDFIMGKGSSHHVVLVVSVEEGDAVGVEVDGVPLFEPLLEAGDAPDGDHQVGREHHQHDRLHPLEGECVAQLVPGK